MCAGQGDWWAERAVGRGCSMPGAPAAAAARWTEQTSRRGETKRDAAEPDNDADGRAAGEWSCGGWRDTGRLINFILFYFILLDIIYICGLFFCICLKKKYKTEERWDICQGWTPISTFVHVYTVCSKLLFLGDCIFLYNLNFWEAHGYFVVHEKYKITYQSGWW